MAVKVSVPIKPDRKWVTKEVLKDPAIRADMDNKGQQLAQSATASLNAITKQKLSWHFRSFGHESAGGIYMVGVYTMSNQAIQHKDLLLTN